MLQTQEKKRQEILPLWSPLETGNWSKDQTIYKVVT